MNGTAGICHSSSLPRTPQAGAAEPTGFGGETVQHDGPAVAPHHPESVKRILGTVPVEKDGSVNFKVPPGRSLYFQLLDED